VSSRLPLNFLCLFLFFFNYGGIVNVLKPMVPKRRTQNGTLAGQSIDESMRELSIGPNGNSDNGSSQVAVPIPSPKRPVCALL
jgi:hypothetical protein